jgi:glycosyltransferase involved in cell wall biosynthesis
MKIFQITTFFLPVTGGVETHVYNLGKELISQGHEVTVLASDSAKFGPRLSRNETVLNGIKIKRFFTLISLSQFHKFYPGLFFYLCKNDFDVVHVHGFRKFETYVALFVAHIKKKKVILTTHNPFSTPRKSRSLSSFLLKFHDITFGKWFSKKIDKIITVVKSETEILTNEFKVPKENIVTIPNGVEEAYFTKGDSQQFLKEFNIKKEDWQAIVIGCGRLNIMKGFQNLKQAVTDFPKVLFFIAGGDDGYQKKLKKIFFGFQNVKFSGYFLPTTNVINALAASDIFVLPSIHEPFGIILLEAMASGLPVIATTVGGPKEFIPAGTALFADPAIPEQWSQMISKLLDSATLRKDLSEKGNKLAQRYRWNKIAEKIFQLY